MNQISATFVKHKKSDVQDWILELGVEDYQLTNEKEELGDTNKNDAVTVIITHVKRAIYYSKTEGTVPTLYLVKTLKKPVNHERYKATITGKPEEFEKGWEILMNI